MLDPTPHDACTCPPFFHRYTKSVLSRHVRKLISPAYGKVSGDSVSFVEDKPSGFVEAHPVRLALTPPCALRPSPHGITTHRRWWKR